MADAIKPVGVRLVAENEAGFTRSLNNANRAVDSFGQKAKQTSSSSGGVGQLASAAGTALPGAFGSMAGSVMAGGLALTAVIGILGAAGAAVHSSELHAADSEVAGQACATPMKSADATVRVREDDPPPHATEQLLQPLQLPTLQSVHVIAEQATLLDRAGHTEPPPYAASLTERERCELP
jgi:hypothetical protein